MSIRKRCRQHSQAIQCRRDDEQPKTVANCRSVQSQSVSRTVTGKEERISYSIQSKDSNDFTPRRARVRLPCELTSERSGQPFHAQCHIRRRVRTTRQSAHKGHLGMHEGGSPVRLVQHEFTNRNRVGDGVEGELGHPRGRVEGHRMG